MSTTSTDGTDGAEQADREERQARLKSLESRIRNIDMGWIRQGVDLWEILRDKLYRLRADNFEDYLRGQHWPWKPRHGFNLIAGAKVAHTLNKRGIVHSLSLNAALTLRRLKNHPSVVGAIDKDVALAKLADLQSQCVSEAITGCGHDSPTEDYLAAAVAAILGPTKSRPRKKPLPRPFRFKSREADLTIIPKKDGADYCAVLQAALAQALAQRAAPSSAP